jgi:hypothetical protein
MGFLRKIGEATNVVTDRRYKEKAITELSHAELVAAYRSTGRAKASTATGITLNGGASLAVPIFFGAAAFNGHQFTVSYINRRRVKEEVARRKVTVKGFAEWFEQVAESKETKDLLVGVGVKTAFTTVSFGVVGFDSIGDNITELVAGGPPPEGTPAALAAERTEAAEDALFKLEHPHAAAAEEFREGALGFNSKPIAENLNLEVLGNAAAIETETSWFDIAQAHDNGFSAGTLGAQVVGIGAGSEALQVPTVAGEVIIDQNLKKKQQKTAEQNGMPGAFPQ